MKRNKRIAWSGGVLLLLLALGSMALTETAQAKAASISWEKMLDQTGILPWREIQSVRGTFRYGTVCVIGVNLDEGVQETEPTR